jgi:hypothetical protein
LEDHATFSEGFTIIAFPDEMAAMIGDIKSAQSSTFSAFRIAQ